MTGLWEGESKLPHMRGSFPKYVDNLAHDRNEAASTHPIASPAFTG